MKNIKLIAIALVSMIVIGAVAYFWVTEDFTDKIDDLVNPDCIVPFEKSRKGDLTLWEYGRSYIAWDSLSKTIVIDWGDPSIGTSMFETAISLLYQPQPGASWIVLARGNLESSSLKSQATWLYNTMDDVRGEIAADPNEFAWSWCMVHMIKRGDA